MLARGATAATDNNTYVWRFPKWFVASLVALTMGPLVMAQAYSADVLWDFAPVRESMLAIALVVAICAEAWFLSKIAIRDHREHFGGACLVSSSLYSTRCGPRDRCRWRWGDGGPVR